MGIKSATCKAVPMAEKGTVGGGSLAAPGPYDLNDVQGWELGGGVIGGGLVNL